MPVIRNPNKNFAAKQAAATSPMVSKALFLCRGRNGLDQVCVGALAKALALDAKADVSTREATGAARSTTRYLPPCVGATDAFQLLRIRSVLLRKRPGTGSHCRRNRQIRLPWPSGQVTCRRPPAVIFADSRVRRTN
jgi:hypothetical protein